MFIGHFAVGLASKAPARRTPLVWLLIAPLFLDLLWPVFLLLGIEHVRITPGITAFNALDLYDYPWSHSLLMSLVWSALYGALVFALYRDRVGAWVSAAGVFSHWVLDFVTHRPDMPLWPGSATEVGLGLWNSVPGTVVIEGAIWIAGIALYLRATRAKSLWGWVSIGSLVLLLSAMYVSDVIAPAVPPDAKAMAYFGLSAWIVVPWAWWIERTRVAVPQTGANG